MKEEGEDDVPTLVKDRKDADCGDGTADGGVREGRIVAEIEGGTATV